MLVNQRLKSLAGIAVANAAMLVADHTSGEVLAWVVGGAGDDDVPGHMIDAVTTPRQPGSSMKPFLYGLALEMGWTAALMMKALDEALVQRAVVSQTYSESEEIFIARHEEGYCMGSAPSAGGLWGPQSLAEAGVNSAYFSDYVKNED